MKDHSMLKQIGSKNAHVLTKPNGDEILFSYQTPVAAKIGSRFYRTEEKYSRTTTRHINLFLQGVQAEEVPQSEFSWVV